MSFKVYIYSDILYILRYSDTDIKSPPNISKIYDFPCERNLDCLVPLTLHNNCSAFSHSPQDRR